MIDPRFEFYIIAGFSAWFAVTAGFVWLTWRIGKTCDDRHTRRIGGFDPAHEPDDEWAPTVGPCEPSNCDACDTCRPKIEGERK